MAGRLAAVTGATGFLGQHLVRALSDDGWDVRILARRDPISPFWRGIEPEVVIGGLHDAAALDRLCAGADVLIHAAGLIKARSRAAFDAVNRDGARDAAQAALRAKVSRTLLISSLAAREPQLSGYAGSKRAGEAAAAEVLGARLTVVRPPAIYGPGDRETLAIFQAALTSPILPVFDPKARIAAMHVTDAARQIAAIAAKPPPQGLVTLCDDHPEGYGWRELVEAAARAVGREHPRIVRLPDQLLSLLGAGGAIARLFGATPMLTPGKARELRHSAWGLSASEICLGLPSVAYTLDEGFRDTVAWSRAAHMLGR